MDSNTCAPGVSSAGFVDNLLSAMAVILGGSSILVWMSLFTSSSAMFSSSSDSLSSFESTIIIFGLLTPLVRCGYAAAASRFPRFFQGRKTLVVAAVLSAVSLPVVSVSFAMESSSMCAVVRMLGVVLAATFGAAYLMPRWIGLIVRFDAVVAMVVSGASFFVFSLIHFALIVLPSNVLPAFSAVFPLLACACFLFSEGQRAEGAAVAGGALKGKAAFYIFLLACSTFFFGLIGQIVRALTWSQFSGTNAFTSAFHEAGISLAALLICIYVAVSHSRGIDRSNQTPGVSCLFVVALGIIVPGVANREAMPVADVALGVGLGCLQIQLCYYAACLVRETGASPFMTFGILYSPLEVAGSVGIVAMDALVASSVEWSSFALVIVVALFLMMFVALLPFFRNQKTIIAREASIGVGGDNDGEPAVSKENVVPPEDVLCAALCPFCLTSREEQVALLLLKGRSLPYIQQELSISEGTAKTHVSHIYRKCGVHTRQEFLDLIHAQ